MFADLNTLSNVLTVCTGEIEMWTRNRPRGVDWVSIYLFLILIYLLFPLPLFSIIFLLHFDTIPWTISTRIIVSSHRDNEYETLGNFMQERKQERKEKDFIRASNAAIEKNKVRNLS